MLKNAYYSYFFVEKNPTFSYFSVKKAPTFFLLFCEWLLEGLRMTSATALINIRGALGIHRVRSKYADICRVNCVIHRDQIMILDMFKIRRIC